jgi:hypothetical protein
MSTFAGSSKTSIAPLPKFLNALFVGASIVNGPLHSKISSKAAASISNRKVDSFLSEQATSITFGPQSLPDVESSKSYIPESQTSGVALKR